MMAFHTAYFIPFHQVDAAGILFFGHVFTFAHQAFENFLTDELRIPWKQWFQNSEWCVPIIQTHSAYHHPLHAGDHCQIQLEVVEIRQTSFRIDYRIKQKDILCCEAYTVHVFCNKQTQQKIEIPPSIRQALEKHLSRVDSTTIR